MYNRNMKKNWTRTLIISGGHFWVDYYCAMLLPLLPFIALRWGLSNTQLALVFTIQSLTANFIQPFLGHVMDKNSAKWSLNFGMLLIALPICLLFLAPNYPLLVLMVAVGGLGSAVYHPLGASRAVEGPAQERALKMSVFSGLGSLGFAISPAITASIVSGAGIKALAFLLTPGFLMTPLLYRVRHFSTRTKEQEETGASKDDYKPMFMISAVVGLRAWLATATSVFIPLWLVSRGFSEKTAGLHLTYYLLAGTVGGFVLTYLYRWLTTKSILILSFLGSGILMPLYLYSSGYMNILLLLALGLVFLGTLPITIVLGQEILPTRTGLASGLTMGLSFGLGAMGNILTGMLADHWGIKAAVLLTTLAMLPAIILTAMLNNNSRNSQREETSAI